MGNLFCSEYTIHRRFDLKGSSLGRMTDKPESEIESTTILKDLDLNFIFRLQNTWFQEFRRLNFFILSAPKILYISDTVFCREIFNFYVHFDISLKTNCFFSSSCVIQYVHKPLLSFKFSNLHATYVIKEILLLLSEIKDSRFSS